MCASRLALLVRKGFQPRLRHRIQRNVARGLEQYDQSSRRGSGGLAVFDLIRGHGALAAASLWSRSTLIGSTARTTDASRLRRRKRALAKLLKRAPSSLAVNEQFRYRWRDRVSRSLPARLRGHCIQSGWARHIFPAAQSHWLEDSRIPWRRPSNVKLRKIGDD